MIKTNPLKNQFNEKLHAQFKSMNLGYLSFLYLICILLLSQKLATKLNEVYDKMNVQIVNSTGQTMKQFMIIPAAGQTIRIPVNTLTSDAYFLYLQSGDEKQVLQLVKE